MRAEGLTKIEEGLLRECLMGTFYTKCTIANHINRKRTVYIPKIVVDTGSEYTWVSTEMLKQIGVKREKKDLVFIMANGQKITKSIGFAIIKIEDHFTIDEVVFGEEGDMLLLGARSLEGLNLIVDSRLKKLLPAGPTAVSKEDETFIPL